MHPHTALLAALLATGASAHGVVTLIKGANGVDMPGLSVADGTPRDCSTNRCGSQADTSIIRDREIRRGDVGPLGRTQGAGPVDAATAVGVFMGGATGATGNAGNATAGAGAASGAGTGAAGNGTAAAGNGTAAAAAAKVQAAGTGEEDDLSALSALTNGNGQNSGNGRNGRNKQNNDKREAGLVGRQLLKGLKGLLGGGGAGGNKGQDSTVATESNVAASAGQGATSGLPTCADDGTIELVYHQVNQDGAGPLDASIDGTSGGTDPAAFQTATVTQDVPGLGVQGLSLATKKDFTVKVQMPQGMTCDATVAGVNNVCVLRVRNGAAAGPFGGSAAFTMSAAAQKRAVEFRMRKRALSFSA
ncbi:hypothetical protein B0J18DRAFT_28943 [Chaetomium sp. MPI-SDFR-AT-0129]|nr:hypothetical protein B0J18DRAFT_28943 [Chaetomium sp. MPI-SDFR-AT-0129]